MPWNCVLPAHIIPQPLPPYLYFIYLYEALFSLKKTPLHMEDPKFIIVIGASAGGMNALTELVSQFNEDLKAAIFIVMHLSRSSISDFLVHRLQPHTSLKCEVAKEGGAIEKGHIYVAAPNKHLLVKKGKILLGNGPEENRWRPSIDVLFRSAAAAYSTRVIGVILTGSLDDGTTGMLAIKRSGGVCIVQDPNEAEYPDMPLSVLNNMEVNYSLSLSEIGGVIFEITQTDPREIEAPSDIITESEIAERVVVNYDSVRKIGEKSIYACPDCGGGLWTINKQTGKTDRYRCHIGHSYSEDDLVVKQGEILESTLWTALRIMEERRNLLKKMEDDGQRKGLSKMALSYQKKGQEIQFHVDKMKEILYATQDTL
jgi:two-component system chemotaxis response regulator CheB